MVATNYAWNPIFDCITEETNDVGTIVAEYTQEPKLYGGLISQHRSGATSIYHYDAIGTTRALTDSGQNVTDTKVYTAFGEKVASAGTTPHPFGFVGKRGYYDHGSLTSQYVRAREYSSKISRWLSVDPFQFIFRTHISQEIAIYSESFRINIKSTAYAPIDYFSNGTPITHDIARNSARILPASGFNVASNNALGAERLSLPGQTYYHYCNSSPTRQVDPSGQIPCTGKMRRIHVCYFVYICEHRTKKSAKPAPTDDKCSSPLMEGHFYFWDFTPACKIHDDCYAQCNANKALCDAIFLYNMLAICEYALGPSEEACRFMAHEYANSVYFFAGSAFEKAQDEACQWQSCSCPYGFI